MDVLSKAYEPNMGEGKFKLKDAMRMPLPLSVDNHVIFAGSIVAAPHFLKPLRFHQDGRVLPLES